jgi:hypothetical protein
MQRHSGCMPAASMRVKHARRRQDASPAGALCMTAALHTHSMLDKRHPHTGRPSQVFVRAYVQPQPMPFDRAPPPLMACGRVRQPSAGGRVLNEDCEALQQTPDTTPVGAATLQTRQQRKHTRQHTRDTLLTHHTQTCAVGCRLYLCRWRALVPVSWQQAAQPAIIFAATRKQRAQRHQAVGHANVLAASVHAMHAPTLGHTSRMPNFQGTLSRAAAGITIAEQRQTQTMKARRHWQQRGA